MPWTFWLMVYETGLSLDDELVWWAAYQLVLSRIETVVVFYPPTRFHAC